MMPEITSRDQAIVEAGPGISRRLALSEISAHNARCSVRGTHFCWVADMVLVGSSRSGCGDICHAMPCHAYPVYSSVCSIYADGGWPQRSRVGGRGIRLETCVFFSIFPFKKDQVPYSVVNDRPSAAALVDSRCAPTTSPYPRIESFIRPFMLHCPVSTLFRA